MKESQPNNNQELSRGLKSRHVQLIALGGTIGTGLFLGAGQSIHLAGPSILLAYLITGIMCFLLMRALGELLLSDLNVHSYIDFIQRYLGDNMSFVAGWTYWVCWITIAMAEVTAAGQYMQFWFPQLPQWVTALVLLGILLTLNSVTVKAFGETEFWFAIIKIVAIIALILAGAYMAVVHFPTPAGHASVANLASGGFFANGAKGFFLSFQMVLFSFVGIEMVGMTASETADPNKVIPKAINEIPMRIILFYLGSLLALMCIYPWQAVSPTSSPFVQVFKNVGIQSAAAVINFVVLTAAASACNSSLFTTGRMLFSLTYRGEGRFAKHMGKLSRAQVPVSALRFSTLVIAVSVFLNFIIPGHVFAFVSSVATTCFLFIWGLIVIAHLKYKRQQATLPNATDHGFHMPFFPLSDYAILLFLIMVAAVLLFRVDTLIALMGSVLWLIALSAGKYLKDRRTAAAIGSENQR
ncbi:amino acid permease [Levilactobacillus koreensis]|uniref:D-alanine/D-serine/glycine permease n=1 Tax=Levilactobacillus koreensis TaxID=637971 RepID=A0AAC8UUE4_9LACO|nr:amino acid permease [Levilactobacillus koreensis]AKP63619.1 D-alanine/D-serine/glycine permease [Levilactobacillus koreensis]